MKWNEGTSMEFVRLTHFVTFLNVGDAALHANWLARQRRWSQSKASKILYTSLFVCLFIYLFWYLSID
jgi:hypothetical protein